MKNLLKKLQKMSTEDSEGSSTRGGSARLTEGSHHNSEHKPFSGLSNWLNSVTHRQNSSPPSSSDVPKLEKAEPSNSVSSVGSGVDVIITEAVRRDSNSSNSRDPDVEEEYQIQLALELSAREDPEAVQIEAVKQISLGSCPPQNTPAEVVAYRYWSYNALGYDDKILDGFYDLYGTWTNSSTQKMPSLVDLQKTPQSDNATWEAILVNRAVDTNLLKLEQRAMEIAAKSRSETLAFVGSDLVRQLAVLVSDYMGGPVGNPEITVKAWRSLDYGLKAALGSMVLPLGSLTIGLAHHRALLFKVLADDVDVPCRLVKGRQYTGSDDVAMNFVKLDDGREYIVDLMADPGTLIPADTVTNIKYEESFLSASSLSSSGMTSSSLDRAESAGSTNLMGTIKSDEELKNSSDDINNPSNIQKLPMPEIPNKTNHPFMHARSPSWTEGVTSPAARRMKVKDVSQYMIDAAKENPHLAQKLHDVLLESGVVAPPNLFSEVYPDQIEVSTVESDSPKENKEENRNKIQTQKRKSQDDVGLPSSTPFFPLLPHHHQLKLVEGLGFNQISEGHYGKNMPMAAAAAAAAAVVASSMVVAVAKSSTETTNIELPVAAAATATAAAVVATTAAVAKQYEQMGSDGGGSGASGEGRGSGASREGSGSGGKEHNGSGAYMEGERTSDRSAGNDSVRSDVALDDVAEIPWEEITLGDRIGLGSYGEVYRGDWHGTEVAVKRFLDQDISGESLEEFRSEVRIMSKARHPNVVLFMGAVTRPPNLSIITEFLPRGSLYRLLHRPNNQLDERRRLRMALDAARGMNYLHNCSPVIVHRDLKSPNLLVDKNWVVKVCDFGLSRMKHSTFLSSRSTAGTAEWMAPEVLRNEPSDEKCDVYSYGVILWELCTLQQPWGGMNPMQVVGAVGFQHRRLDIPDDVDPTIADIIRRCWQTDPKLRPSFADIMAALKPLQKPIISSRHSAPAAQPSPAAQDSAD